MDWLFGMLHLP